MRGLDYRAPLRGITLIVAASFENRREASQGLHRVGRFSDLCDRYLVHGVPLVDEIREDLYYGRLLKFIEAISKPLNLKKAEPVAAAGAKKRDEKEKKELSKREK
jgi:hypothetical protein